MGVDELRLCQCGHNARAHYRLTRYCTECRDCGRYSAALRKVAA